MPSQFFLASAVVLTCIATNAHAYRPFDGTDAAVTEEGVFELEAGVGHTRIGDVDSVALPSLVFNYGLPHDTEIALEGQVNHQAASKVDSLGDTQLTMKHVFVKGSLQDATGTSVASECAVLLPEAHGSSGIGGECAAIVSNQWDALALHLNLGLGRAREHDWARTASLIAEGPGKWLVRPVTELLAERDSNGARLDSALLGAIWQHGDDLAFDIALRRAQASGGNFNEVRIGLTWSLALAKP